MLDTRFWKKYFQVYDTLNELIPYQELLGSFLRSLGPVAGNRILDLGAGTGNLSLLLAQAGADVTGVDFSRDALAVFETKIPRAHATYGDIKKPLPFADNEFDAVVSNNVLYAVSRPHRPSVLGEVRRVLKTGGKFVVANITTDFSPLAIYRSHLRSSRAKKGTFKTFADACMLVVPTVLIFYYNFLIAREHRKGDFDFFAEGEQTKSLADAGFKTVIPEESVYAGQSMISVAIK